MVSLSRSGLLPIVVHRITDREDGFMGGDGKWKLLITTQDEAEIYLLKSRLESEGITCRVEAPGGFPERSYTGGLKEYRAYVPLGEFEASQQVLEEGELAEEDRS